MQASAYASLLTLPKTGVNFGYKWQDMEFYGASTVSLDSFVSIDPHQFFYDFEYIYGREIDDMLSFYAGYGYKEGKHWFGGSIGSAGTSPFSRLNTIDIDVFYAFLFVSRITQYAEGYDGQMYPFYLNLYVGADYSTSRLLLDSYPLPVIRFEYGLPNLNLIIGFPLTYLYARINQQQFFELTYVPVMNINLAYGIMFNKYNTVKLTFDIEHKQYRSYRSSPVDTFLMAQSKYYTEIMSVGVEYNLNVADVMTIAPYFGFIPMGRSYYGKTFDDYSNLRRFGIGYEVGINLNIKI